jgi:anti-sigma regulatory factor (Ser/Thr protein kinase)
VARATVDAIINQLLLTKGSFSSGDIARRAKVSRQAVHRHLKAMLEAGRIVADGQGRSVRYRAPSGRYHRRFLRQGLAEDAVWQQVRSGNAVLEQPQAASARAVLGYAFTEMLNNAIDHSGSRHIEVSFEIAEGKATFDISDQGVGVYENVRSKFGLPDTITALQEISKGKLTTRPEAHTGQGIFFTSKAADVFQLTANGLMWTVDNRRQDVAIADTPSATGTTVRVDVSLTTTTALDAIFARYSQHDFEFDTSRVVVKLFERGGEFVSRSEAKRVLAGLEKFRHVIVDFQGIHAVGQGFADEVFRVWASAHPDVRLEPVNMGSSIEQLVVAVQRTTAVGGRLVPDLVREVDFPLGWTESSIRTVHDDPDAVTRLPALQDPEGKVFVATRRDIRSASWKFVAIIVGRGERGDARVMSAFILPRATHPESLWASPVECLRTFLNDYGREFTVGQSRPKKLFLEESYPLAGFGRQAPPFVVTTDPGRRHLSTIRHRVSDLGAVSVTIGYDVDYTKYAAALTRAGIQIKFDA